MKRLIAILAVTLLLAGCGAQVAVPTEPFVEKANVTQDLTKLFTDRDYETAYEKAAKITLSDGGSTCDSDAVKIDGNTVTVTDEGTYVLTGKLSDGQIVVRADKTDKTHLVLENVTIGNATAAPIYIEQADKVFVTLVGENGLTAESLDESIDAALFSKEDLTINGSGSLTIASPLHGIVSKDELTVTGGTFDITCASHGVAGKDNLCIDGGKFTVAAGKDGLHSENQDDETLGFVYIKSGEFCISAEGDGISAAAWMQIDGGTYDITTGGGSENGQKQTSDRWGGMGGGKGPGGFGGKHFGDRGDYQPTAQQTVDTTDSTSIKGIKAGKELILNGGTYTLNCADDALHSNSNLTVTAGEYQIATGDDGFHADETLTVSGGSVSITTSYEGLEGLHVKVDGGNVTLVASDDGLNAAGGTDNSGMGGRDQFGGMGGRGFGGMGAGNGSVVITGGTLSVTASGDGIDANGTLEITGGHTTVCGPTRGDTATLDYDKTATISGGTFIGTGGAGMAQTFSSAQQGLISLNAGNVAAGTRITVTDSTGKTLIDYTPAMDFAVVILSSPDLVKGQTYTVQIGTQSQPYTL